MHQLVRFLRAILARFQADDGFRLAASLAYTTILSVVPVVAVALAIFTALPGFDQITEAIQRFFANQLLPQALGEKVLANIDAFAHNAGKLTAVGGLAIALTALILVRTIENAFNRIFRVRRERPILLRMVLYWAFITLGPIVIGVSLVATSFAVSRLLGFAAGYSLPVERLFAIVPWLLVSGSLSILYAVLPNRTVRWRDALIAGVVAASIYEIVGRAFAFYVAGAASTYTTVYGALATVPIFLVWIYVSWVVVILGAEIAALLPDYGHARSHRRHGDGESFRALLTLLQRLVQAQAATTTVTTEHLAGRVRLERETVEAMLERLASAGWVGRLAGEGWTLTCNPQLVTVGEVYRSVMPRAIGNAHSDPHVQSAADAIERAVLTVATPLAALAPSAAAPAQLTEAKATT